MENGKPAKNLKTEIERRTRDTAKLIEIETQKLAVGEMILERMDSMLDLLRAAGFKLPAQRAVAAPLPQQAPPNTVIVQAGALPPEQPPAPIKNPCSVCGQEAQFSEPMPDGTKKFFCRPHGQARAREKAEEAQTANMFGSTGTMYTRPKPTGPPAQKMIIQADPSPPPPPNDPLKGPFPSERSLGGPPPPNPVLDE